jgi:hypothetical protein
MGQKEDPLAHPRANDNSLDERCCEYYNDNSLDERCCEYYTFHYIKLLLTASQVYHHKLMWQIAH